MALPPIPVPPYPDVPNAPGVPPVPRPPNVPPTPPNRSLDRDGTGVANTLSAPRWGIFDKSNKSVIIADSFVGIEFGAEYRVPDYPIEQGGFESYNKVQMPYDARVTFARGGTDADRSAFIEALQAAAKSVDLFSIVTPEKTFINANVVHVAFSRMAQRGATLITADVYLREIRSAAAPAFASPSQPAAADAHDNGNVPPAPSSLPGLPKDPT